MTVSELSCGSILSPNHYSGRAFDVQKITPHHMSGNLSVESCGYWFRDGTRNASSNYGIGSDGRIMCYVDEDDAAWTSSNWDNDNRAITIEVANSYCGGDWPISDDAWNSLVNLCVDICKRYGITMEYTGGPDGTLTEHRMFASTDCPGTYLHNRMGELARVVNERIYDDGKRGVHLHRPNQTPAQQWYFEPTGKLNEYFLRNVACGKYLMLNKSIDRGNGYAVCVGKRNDAQPWKLTQLRTAAPLDKPVFLTTQGGLYLDVVDGKTNSGAGIQARTLSGSKHGQKWVLVWSGQDNVYFLHNLKSDMCLDVDNAGRM